MAESGSNPNPEKALISGSQSLSNEPDGLPRHILIVEDNKADGALIRKALKEADVKATIHELDDGAQAIRFFEHADADPDMPCPDLVLLDINLPRYKGGEILRHLRRSARCREALVLIVTSSDSEKDRNEMDALDANGYFRKPSSLGEFMKLGPLVQELLLLRQTPGPAI